MLQYHVIQKCCKHCWTHFLDAILNYGKSDPWPEPCSETILQCILLSVIPGVIHHQIVQCYILAGNVNLWLFWVVSLQLNQFLCWRLKSLNSFRVYGLRQIQRAIRHFIGWPCLNRFLVPIINCWLKLCSILKGDNKPAEQATQSE